MQVISLNGYPVQAQIQPDYKGQVLDYEKRQELALQFSQLLTVSNPLRLQFIQEAKELFNKYQ